MRILGIDYGRRRIGIGISDEKEIFAIPLRTITIAAPKNQKMAPRAKRWQSIIDEIVKICREKNAETVVVGLPADLAGKDTAMTREVKEFASVLEKTARLAVVFEKEFLTTKLVERKFKESGVKGIKDRVDAAAAAEILQGYLDRINIEKKGQEF